MQVIGNYEYIITSLHHLQEFHSERNNAVKLAAITKVLQNQEDLVY